MKKRELILQALKDAKPHLATSIFENRDKFICYAIYRGANERNAGWRGYDLAQGVVMGRLEGFARVEHWLAHTIGSAAYYAAVDANPNVVQEYRHRWLDALIEEFSQTR